MLGFYLAAGVVLALLAGLCVGWEPLRVHLLKREVLGAKPGSEAQIRAACAVARQGRFGRAAVRGLLAHPDAAARASTCRGLHLAGEAWAVPLLMEASRDADPQVAGAAIMAVVGIAELESLKAGIGQTYPLLMLTLRVGERDMGPLPIVTDEPLVEALRWRLEDWWKREGRAKYGRDE